MKKSLLFVVLFLFSNLKFFAFEYKVNLLEKSFKKTKYDFSILKVIDGRLNKKKPMGFIVERINHQLEAMWVGHDSLGESMTAFFKPKHEIFDTSLKIMLVLNQCNLRHIYGYHIAQAIEIKISFDYYKLNGDKYELIYQQYFIHKENTKLVRNAAKAITIAFSETVKLAMEDFNKQIALKTSLPVKELMADSLLGFLYKKQSQEVTNQNIKDGIYFSCKDLYLNKPSTFKDFSFNVSANRENPLNLNTKNYIIEKAYAIVKEKRIFIFISDNYYKEALLSDDRILYFPDVTRTSLSKSARANSAAVGVAGAILPLGFLGGLVTAMAQSEIKESGTTQTKTDVIVDFETSDLEYKN